MDFRFLAKQFNNALFTRQVILYMLKEYKRPNDKISELIKNGNRILLKRGLCIPGRNIDLTAPEPFLIANYLWGPSYVSFETALSYWNFIPERVFEISSVKMKLSKKIKTPVGRFTYRFMPSPYYSFGIKSLEVDMDSLPL